MISSAIRPKGESQNGGYKTKQPKFSEKLTLFAPSYALARLSWGKKR